MLLTIFFKLLIIFTTIGLVFRAMDLGKKLILWGNEFLNKNLFVERCRFQRKTVILA